MTEKKLTGLLQVRKGNAIDVKELISLANRADKARLEQYPDVWSLEEKKDSEKC